MDLKAAYARAVAELADAEAQYRAAEQRVRELEAIRDGLQLAMNRYEKAPQVAGQEHLTGTVEAAREGRAASSADVPERRSLPGIPDRPRKGAVPSNVKLAKAALRDLGPPKGTVEIRVRLEQAGYPRKTSQVRGALVWAEEKGEVVRVAPGTWDFPKGASSQDDFTPAAETAGVGPAGENGHSRQSHVLAGADAPHGR